MKKSLYIISILFILVFSSCNHKEYNKILKAESLIKNNRDSAMLLLNEVTQIELLPDSLQALYWLCIANIHANNHQSLVEDSLILRSANYYEKLYKTENGNINKILEDRYIKARSLCILYYWWNNEKEKVEQLSEEIINKAKEKDNIASLITALRISSIVMFDYDYNKVLNYSEELLQIKKKSAIHHDEYSRIYNGMAIASYYIGDYSRMKNYFEKSIKNTNDSSFVWQIAYRNYADLLGEIGEHDKAISMHEELVEKYITYNDFHLTASYFSLSRLYLLKKKIPLAIDYIEKAKQAPLYDEYLESHPSVRAMLLAYEQTLNYIQNGTYSITELAALLNKIEENQDKQQLILQAKERSKRDLHERNLQLTISKQKQAIALISLVFFISIVATFSLLINDKRKRLIIEKEERAENIQRLLNEALTSQENTAGSIKKMMLQQLGVIKTLASNPTQDNQQMLNRLLSIDENSVNTLLNWDSLYQSIDYAYNGYYSKLVQEYGQLLNTREIQLCCLLKAQFSTKEINILTKQSLQTIYQRKSQIRAKLGTNEFF